MKITIAIIASLLAIVGNVPYLRDIIKGRVQPHPYTWLVWSLVSCIIFWTSCKRAGLVHFRPLRLKCLLLSSFSFRSSMGSNIFAKSILSFCDCIARYYSRLLTKDPTISVIIAVAIDVVAFIPTMRKTWARPETETPILYGMNVLRHILMLFSLQAYNIATTLHSIVMITTNTFMTVVIMRIYRRKK